MVRGGWQAGDGKADGCTFQDFFRGHSEHWEGKFDYLEAGPQLLLQAFLKRIVNAGGRVEREYGLGRMRTDLLVVWHVGEVRQKTVIECKLRWKGLESVIAEGVVRLASIWTVAGPTRVIW